MTPSQPVSTPARRIRLMNGVRVVNRNTNETEPTYGEYVMAEDYESLERSLREAVELLAARDKTIEALKEDAARYNHLKEACSNGDSALIQMVMEKTDDECDATIDAARLKDGTKETQT